MVVYTCKPSDTGIEAGGLLQVLGQLGCTIRPCLQKSMPGACDSATKPDELDPILRTHMVEGKDGILQIFL